MKGGGLAAILGKGPSAPGADEDIESSESLAQDIIDAIKDDNAVALDAALKSHYDECQMDESEPDDLAADDYSDEE